MRKLPRFFVLKNRSVMKNVTGFTEVGSNSTSYELTSSGPTPRVIDLRGSSLSHYAQEFRLTNATRAREALTIPNGS